jgi:hypothetical protein
VNEPGHDAQGTSPAGAEGAPRGIGTLRGAREQAGHPEPPCAEDSDISADDFGN